MRGEVAVIDAISDVDDAIADSGLSFDEWRLAAMTLPGRSERDVADLDEGEQDVLKRLCTKLADYLGRHGYSA